MQSLRAEVDANYVRFAASWKGALQSAQIQLAPHNARFQESYRRLTTLQAWRTVLLEPVTTPESLEFFLEAQNDALVSHTLAQLGSWRTALMSLRSCIENVVFFLYYKDHPVELELWQRGRHRLPFSSGITYLKGHPAVEGVPKGLAGLELIEKEYSTLSRAVHASAKSFRMTTATSTPTLWSFTPQSISGWSTRERSVIQGLNYILLCLFREALCGTRLPNLRKSISLVVPRAKHVAIRQHYKVSLY